MSNVSLLASPSGGTNRRVSVITRATRIQLLMAEQKTFFMVMFSKFTKRYTARNVGMMKLGMEGFKNFVKSSKKKEKFERMKRIHELSRKHLQVRHQVP